MTDFRSALKPRSGPKPGSEIKTSTPAKVDFRSLLNKKDGSPKGPAATPPPSGTPSDLRSVLNKKQAPQPEKNEANEQNLSKPGPKIPQKDIQSGINVVNGGAIDKKVTITEKSTTEKKTSSVTENKTSSINAGPVDKKVIAPEKASPEKKKNDGEIAENNNKKRRENGEKKDAGSSPVFTQSLSDVTVVDGERLRLECQVTSTPPALITWMLDGKVVKPSKFIILSQEGMRRDT